MRTELTNLLPRERRDALRRQYFLRLGVVSACFVAALAVGAAVLLIPTYVFLIQSTSAKETRLANIQATLAASDEATTTARLAVLSANIAALTALQSAPSASLVIRSALAVPHPGVALSSFAYTPSVTAKKNKGTLLIGGTAVTRGDLRAYQLALQSSSFFLGADLPVSAYAKDTNSPFTITLTLAP